VAHEKEEPKPNYVGFLPAPVRYDKNIGMSEKVMFTEIAALSNKYGYCYASNAYFANLYETQVSTVNNWIKKLEKYGYVEIENSGKPSRKIKLLFNKKLPNEASTQLEALPDEAAKILEPNKEEEKNIYNTKSIIYHFVELYNKKCGMKPAVSYGGWTRLLKILLKDRTEEEVKRVMDYFFAYKGRTRFDFYAFYNSYNNLAPSALKTKPQAQGATSWTCKHCGHVNFNTLPTCVKCMEDRWKPEDT